MIVINNTYSRWISFRFYQRAFLGETK